MSATQLQKIRAWHEYLVELEIMHPTLTLSELSKLLGKSLSWISIVKNSDAYREYRMQRIGEHQTIISASTSQKLEALAEITTDEMLKRVEEEREKLSIADLGGMAALALKSLGYGSGSKASPVQHNTQNNFYGTPPKSVLAKARESYRRVHNEESQPALPPGTVPSADPA